jgi:hypothetical protein
VIQDVIMREIPGQGGRPGTPGDNPAAALATGPLGFLKEVFRPKELR